MTAVNLTPRPGHVVAVSALPVCNFCGQPGTWDGPTIYGPWANFCDACEPILHAHPGQTGVGIGQRLFVPVSPPEPGTVGAVLAHGHDVRDDFPRSQADQAAALYEAEHRKDGEE
jgi:hypothetical protein